MLHGQANAVQPVQQAVLAERVNLKVRLKPLAIRDKLLLKIDGQLITGANAVEDLANGLFR